MATEDFGATTEDFDGEEIPQELLDVIAGGVMTDDVKAWIRDMCARRKAAGNDLYVMERFMRKLADGRLGFGYWEMCDYMEKIWPEL